MTEQNYFDIKAVNNSLLNTYEQSPKKAGLIYKGIYRQEETEAMRLGNMVHMMVLNADKYVDKYIVSDFEKPKSPQMESFLGAVVASKVSGGAVDRSSERVFDLFSLHYKRPISKKDATIKEAYDAIRDNMAYINAKVESLSQNKEIVPLMEHNTVCSMVESIFSHKAAKSLLESGNSKFIEQTLLFKSKNGIDCKAKPDIYIVDDQSEEVTLIDIKTTRENVLNGFISEIYKRKYYRQLAFYDEALRVNGYDTFDISHKIIVVNKEDGIFDCAVYNIDPRDIQHGKQELDDLLSQITYSIINDYWDFSPNYYIGNGIINLPPKFIN